MRVVPVGSDAAGRTYWYLSDDAWLFRETQKENPPAKGKRGKGGKAANKGGKKAAASRARPSPAAKRSKAASAAAAADSGDEGEGDNEDQGSSDEKAGDAAAAGTAVDDSATAGASGSAAEAVKPAVEEDDDDSPSTWEVVSTSLVELQQLADQLGADLSDSDQRALHAVIAEKIIPGLNATIQAQERAAAKRR